MPEPDHGKQSTNNASGLGGVSCDRRRFLESSAVAAVVGVVGLGAVARYSPAEEPPQKPRRRTWIAAIGVNHYDSPRISSLGYCVADAEAIAWVFACQETETMPAAPAANPTKDLEAALGERLLLMTDGADERKRPTRQNIHNALSEFLKKPHPDDRVILYFGGHGEVGKDKQSFLLPSDCDPDNVGLMGVSVDAVRTLLNNCRASQKFLFIDACHADEQRPQQAMLSDDGLKVALQGAAGLFVLSSCGQNEQSREWPEKRHGIFTYWLLQGLYGAADFNGDAAIDFDELYKFVRSEVQYSAHVFFDGAKQTPVRVVGDGAPEIVHLKREPITATLRRVSEILHGRILRFQHKLLAVREFANRIGDQSELRGNLGTFGVLAAERIEQALMRLGADLELGANQYGLLPGKSLRQHLKNITLDELEQPRVLQSLAEHSRLEAVVVGEFRRLANPDRLVLNCQLRELQSTAIRAVISSVIQIDAELLAMLGASGELTPPNSFVPASVPMLHEQLTQASQSAHPLDPERPAPRNDRFSIVFRSGPPRETKREVKPVARGTDANKLFLGFVSGDEYEIELTNRSDEWVAVRVFVDGLNVLGATAELTKFAPRSGDQPVDYRELPHEALPWIFPGKTNLVLNSFHRPEKLSPDGTIQFGGGKFIIGPVERSLAGQQGLSSSVGQITVLLYRVKGIPRSVATIEGERVQKVYRTIKGVAADNEKMLAAYTFRYVDASALS